MAQNYLDFEGLSTFLSGLFRKFALLKHDHTTSEITDYVVDSELSLSSTNPVQNKVVNTGFSIVGNAISNLESSVANKLDISSYVVDSQLSSESTNPIQNATVSNEFDIVKDYIAQKSQVQFIESDIAEVLPILKIHKMSQEEYEQAVANGTIEDNVLYLTPNTNSDASGSLTDEELAKIYETIEASQLKYDNAIAHSDENLDTAKQYADTVASNKADKDHNHDDMYYTEAEMDYKLDTVNASITNITNGSTLVAKAEEANHATSSDTASSAISATSATKATQDASGNVITSTYETKTDATAKLDSAKSYTDSKVSGLASTSTVDNKISAHNTSTSAHNDIRDLINGLTTRLNTLADSDDTTLDQMSEVVAYIKSNKNLIDSITTSKVSVSDIVDNLTTNVTNKPLSAAQGVAIKSLIDALQIELDAHGHDIANVSGLQTVLDGKSDSTHNHDESYDVKGAANTAFENSKVYTDSAVAQKSQVQIITWEADD